MNITTFVLTILGTSSSVGIPVIGCKCDLCKSTDPRDKRLRTSAWLHSENTSIFFDCGEDFRQQCLTHNVQSIDSVLITHEHFDHIGGIEMLKLFFDKKLLNIYGHHRVLDVIKNRCFIFYSTPKNLIYNPVDSEFITAGIRFVPIPVIHGDLEIYGYRFGNAAYITDTKYISNESIALLHGIENLIVNSSGPKKSFLHFEYNETLNFITKTDAKQIYLIHFKHHSKHIAIQQYFDENKNKFGLEDREITVCYDGLEIHGIDPFFNF